MVKVEFKFDLIKDAKNYYDTANSDINYGHDFTKSIRLEVYKKLKGKKWDDVKKYMINLLKRGYKLNKEKNEKKLKEIKSAWKKVESRYFKKLEKITKEKIYT